MTKRHLFAEIKQGFDALSCARKAEKNLNTIKVKLITAPKLGAKKFHSIKESKAQGIGQFRTLVPLKDTMMSQKPVARHKICRDN